MLMLSTCPLRPPSPLRPLSPQSTLFENFHFAVAEVVIAADDVDLLVSNEGGEGRSLLQLFNEQFYVGLDSIGQRVRTLRRKRKWTQVELAEMLGIDRSYLSEIETGKKDPSLRVLKTLADGFNMSLSQLLKGF